MIPSFQETQPLRWSFNSTQTTPGYYSNFYPSKLIFQIPDLKRMPGHEKKGASQGEDPDPAPYLFLTFQMKREDMTKPYDAKKSFWVPDGEGGFVEGQLESENGAKVRE